MSSETFNRPLPDGRGSLSSARYKEPRPLGSGPQTLRNLRRSTPKTLLPDKGSWNRPDFAIRAQLTRLSFLTIGSHAHGLRFQAPQNVRLQRLAWIIVGPDRHVIVSRDQVRETIAAGSVREGGSEVALL